MEVKTVDLLKEGTLLPPHPNKCQECGVNHKEDEPHNPDSLYYQMQFKKKYDRWPTWDDAIAHLAPNAQEAIKVILRENNVEI